MRIIEDVRCPYCGFINEVTINQVWDKQIVTCDVDEGGCDREFVIKAYVKADVETFKIEGEEERS